MTKQERDDLVVHHMSYARSLSKGFSGKHALDHIEAESAAINGLVRASIDFSPNGGAAFRTYATHKMMGYMRHALTTEYRHSGSDILPHHSTYTPSDNADLSIDARNLLSLCDDPADADLLVRLAKGDKQTEIAADLGVACSTIKRRAERAKKRILARIN